MMQPETNSALRRLTNSMFTAAVLLSLFSWTARVAVGQLNAGRQYHQPLSQHSPPGQTAGWFNAIRNYNTTWLQPLKIEVRGGGQVHVYSGYNQPVGSGHSPLLAAVNVAHVYRLRVTGMPKYPGMEIYPTVELVDHLHPPAGRENEFPIPIVITEKDIRLAESGQLVTRVIYLEQPQIAQQLDPLHREIPQAVEPKENALWEADRLGRPMAIIRVGGRQPSVNSPASFYGTGGAVEVRPVIVHEQPPPGRVDSNRVPTSVRKVSYQQP